MSTALDYGIASYVPHKETLVGLVAQLVERLNGIQEVACSTHVESTKRLLNGVINKGAGQGVCVESLGVGQGSGRNQQGVSLKEAIDSLLLSKKMGNCRPRYITSLKSYLNLFAKHRENLPVCDVTVFDLEKWFSERSESVSTMASNIGRLSSLFGFAERRGWILKNPCEQLERIRVDRKPPQILTPEQARRLLDHTAKHKPNQLAYFTLALMAGIRPEEIEKLHWSSVDLDGGFVVVDAAASKVRRRRIVYLEPAAIEFLKFAKIANSRLPVKRITRRRYLAHASDLLGFNAWPHDCCRHSAASYLMALHKDAGKVSDWLGNSASILLRHYRELVKPQQCIEFWSMRPAAAGHRQAELF